MRPVLYKKGDELEIEITDLGSEGEGIGKTDAFIWFVKDTLIGDRIRAKVMKCKKNYGYARLLEVIRSSPHRVEPPCPIARACGGCSLQSIDYRAELRFKEEKVLRNLLHIGGFSRESILRREEPEEQKRGGAGAVLQEERVKENAAEEAGSGKEEAKSGEEGRQKAVFYPIIGMEAPWRYRNKSIYPIGEKNGRLIAGFYAARTHSIIECGDCLIGIEENRHILEKILAFMEEFKLPAYDEESGKGLLRHVLIRKGFFTGEIMVCLIINAESFPHAAELVKRLKKIEGIKSIVCNINRERSNVILGKEVFALFGDGYIRDYIGEVEFRISALSFFQINPLQTKKLYEKALEFAGLSGKEIVWDLYCGIGSISLFLAKKAGKVYAVEVVEEAIEDARENAKLNGIENASFFVGRAEELLPRIYESLKRRENAGEIKEGKPSGEVSERGAEEPLCEDMLSPDVIVVDPPRKGCDRECLDTMLKMGPKRIVYVSCDPATLARDLKYLCEEGYELRKVQPVDMFGHGVHVESVVLMSKKDK